MDSGAVNLPPGFELEQGSNEGGSSTVNLPPGFELEDSGNSSGKPRDWISKVYTPVIEGGAMTLGGFAGAVLGAPAGPVGAGLTGSGMAAAMLSPAKHFAASIDQMRGMDNPVNQPKPLFQQAKDVASDFQEGLGLEAGGKVIGKGMELAAPYAKPIFESVSDTLAKSANKRWFKALGGTLQQAKELGPDEAQRLGRLARNERIITPMNSAESQLGSIQQYQDAAGTKIGELRQLGDQMGAAPKFHELIGEIEKELGPKYSSGMRTSQEGQFRNAIDELMKAETVDKIPAEIPEGQGDASIFNKVEKNPDYTPVPETLQVKNPIATPPRSIFGGKKVPEWYQALEDARNPPEIFPYKNPEFIDGKPTTNSIQTNPRNLFEDYRADQEAGNIIPEYDVKQPNTTTIADKITKMNRYAESQKKLLQPSNALTDVANAAAAKNDSALVQSLGSDKGQDYVRALGNFSDSEKLMKILENKLAYETGASRNRIVNNLMNRFEQRFGYPVSAEVLDRLSNAGKSISRFGPGAGLKTAARTGLVLTAEKAKEILKQANWNRDLARQKAREQGYEF